MCDRMSWKLRRTKDAVPIMGSIQFHDQVPTYVATTHVACDFDGLGCKEQHCLLATATRRGGG
jgi:hypothetical protein